MKNVGDRDEQLLPVGRDSGYLWRANTFTQFFEVEGGLYVETETLGLSRESPPLIGWIIEPIARRFGRRSAETSVKEFSSRNSTASVRYLDASATSWN